MSDVEKAAQAVVASLNTMRPSIDAAVVSYTAFKALVDALAAQQNSPSADCCKQPFTEGAGASEGASTSALGGLSEKEVLNSDGDTIKTLTDEISAAETYDFLGMPVVTIQISAKNRDHLVAALRASRGEGK